MSMVRAIIIETAVMPGLAPGKPGHDGPKVRAPIFRAQNP
ncbi:hypothetical protein M2323_004096 [Rhodoblastus acidophilus]|nr:hypothetical protein [Rhodoblastus acidophilus]MCW2335151.1 hypothetical protein [Rhodoblastus acidophilus]